MPAMFKANERCYNRTFGLYGLKTLNHRSELKILWDTFRSQIAELWFPYDRRIANDRRRSQKIEHGSIFCDRLRSQKCVSIWSQTIAELSAICDPRSSAIIWKPAFRWQGNHSRIVIKTNPIGWTWSSISDPCRLTLHFTIILRLTSGRKHERQEIKWQ